MGIEYFKGSHADEIVMVCNTSGTAFGPIWGSEEEADAFMEWLVFDPRQCNNLELERIKFLEEYCQASCGTWYRRLDRKEIEELLQFATADGALMAEITGWDAAEIRRACEVALKTLGDDEPKRELGDVSYWVDSDEMDELRDEIRSKVDENGEEVPNVT